MKSNPKILQQLQHSLKSDKIIKEICYKMIIAHNSKKPELVEKFNILYNDRRQEIINAYFKKYNVETIQIYEEDVEMNYSYNVKNKTKLTIFGKLFVVIFISFIIAAIVGEVLCVVKFCKSDFEPSYKREIIYGVVTITGLGSIVGYLNIEDVKK